MAVGLSAACIQVMALILINTKLQGAERACYDVWMKGRSVQMFAGENESEGSLMGVLQ